MRRTGSLSLLLVLAVVASACGGENEQTAATDADTIVVAGESANNHGTQDVAGVSEVEVEMHEFYFSPTILTGEAGQTLTVELLNNGSNPHTFTLDAIKVDIEIQPDLNGGTKVTFPESGALLFYCRFHAGGGMRGGLSAGGDLEPAVGSEGTGDTQNERPYGPYG